MCVYSFMRVRVHVCVCVVMGVGGSEGVHASGVLVKEVVLGALNEEVA